jgi:hypothetical protein
MSTKITLTYFGMAGEGRTVKEAKLDAGRKIEAVFDGNWTPFLLQAGDETILCWREPVGGWHYGFARDGRIDGSTWHATRDECDKSARSHLGQIATDWKTCLTVEDVHPIVKHDADRREILGLCQWQRAYARATSAGLDDNNARLFIGGFTNLMSQPVPKGLERNVA